MAGAGTTSDETTGEITPMLRETEAVDAMDDTELTRRARLGEEPAFDELYRRHAAAAWNLAWATSSDQAAARRITVEAFARSFNALRAGRATEVGFTSLLRNQILNAATDAEAPTEATSGDVAAVDALRSLPLTWRVACWLADGELLSNDEVAAALGLDVVGAASLVGRARAGWRERFLQRHYAASGNRNCSRAVDRLRAMGEGPLHDADRAALDRHVRLCDACHERKTMAGDLRAAVGAFLPVVPVLLVDDVRAAWAAAVATPSRRSGLSPRTEKVLAGATAAVAALGLVGAAFVGTGRTDAGAADTTTRLAAPIGTDASKPVPLALSTVPELSAPGALPVAVVAGDADSVQPLAGAGAAAVPLGSNDGGAAGAPVAGDDPTDEIPDDGIPNEGPGDDPTIPEDAVPTASVAVTVADVPVAVAIGDEPGATVGPVSVGSAPAPAPSGEPEIAVGGPLAPAQPVVDEVVAGL